MKKGLSVIIAAAVALVGLIGALVCIIPAASAEYKAVDAFISAIDDCDYDAIYDCFPIEEMSSAFGIDYDEISEKSDEKLETKLDYVKAFCSGAANDIPEDAKSVESIELISCSNAQVQGNEYIKGCDVDCVIKVEYITADDENVSFTVDEGYSLLLVDGDYKIID